MLVTFDEQSDGKTVLTLRQMHPSVERREWAIGFGAVPFQGRLYSGESPDGGTSEVFEVDPVANTATKRFTMDGYFYGLFDLSK